MSTPTRAVSSSELYLRLLRYVAPYRRVFLVAIVGAILVALTEAALPAIMKPLFDGVFVERDAVAIRWMPLIIIGLFMERSRTLHAWDVSLRQVLAPGVNVYGKAGQSFRIPNVNDNYNLFAASVTLLEPQTAHDSEIGVEGNTGPVRYRAAAYRINLRNEIFFDPLTFSNRNLQPTRRQGVELEAHWQVNPAVDVHTNYTYTDAKFREGNFAGVSIAGNAVPLVPRSAVNAGLGWAFLNRARADFDVRRVGSSPFDADETNAFGRKMPAYTVADLKLSLRSGGWLVNTGVRNLFNEKYFSYGVFTGFPTYAALPAPERTLFVSAQYTFQ